MAQTQKTKGSKRGFFVTKYNVQRRGESIRPQDAGESGSGLFAVISQSTASAAT